MSTPTSQEIADSGMETLQKLKKGLADTPVIVTNLDEAIAEVVAMDGFNPKQIKKDITDAISES